MLFGKSSCILYIYIYIKETSSVDIDLLVLLSKNFLLWIQCPKISLLLFKDGACRPKDG